MSMARKDYAGIANILKSTSKYARTRREKQMLLGLASELAGYLSRDNGAFARQTFMDATGTNAYLDKEEP